MSKVKYLIASAIIILMIVFANKVQASTGNVNTETLNLRKEASTSADILKLLSQGNEVEIVSESNGWYKVKFKDTEGFVSKEYITVNNQEEITNSEPSQSGQTITSTNEVGTTMTIESEKLDIKILPLINANSIGTLKKGDVVTVISKANKWTFIQTDSLAGWITTNVTTTKNNNEDKEENVVDNTVTDEPVNNEDETLYDNTVTKYVNSLSVYVRKGPSTSDEIVTSLIKDTDVTVVGENGEWYKIKYKEFEGYIYKNLLSDNKTGETNRSGKFIEIEPEKQESTNTSSSLGEEIVAYAKQYLGCPYVYGGSGSSSFDCSGFTMYVYKHFGYSLSHSASAQSNRGEYVAKENLQPGDLVFFLEYPTMDGIGHCGIYIGNGEFIHASSGTGYCVKISTLLSGSYYNRYATARRLI